MANRSCRQPTWLRCIAPLLIFTNLPMIASQPAPNAGTLASWNGGTARQSIIDFVAKTTREGGPDYIQQPERIAVFDNDGTLWPENPLPFQLAFALDSLQSQIEHHPDWKSDRFVAAALAGDLPVLLADHYKGLFHIIGLTHSGMTTDEFDQRVDTWIRTAKHPRFDRAYDQCIYQPMLEVLVYLRAHGFKTFIVSGGGADFLRVWTERVYGIQPEQVVGSRGGVRFEIRDDKPLLLKTMDELFIDDKAGKPVGIHQAIGRRPVLAFGNSDGDKEMLEYTTIDNPLPSLGVLIHHTDSTREYAYDASPRSSGKLVEALQEAPRRGWVVVSMRDDWNAIFPAHFPAK